MSDELLNAICLASCLIGIFMTKKSIEFNAVLKIMFCDENYFDDNIIFYHKEIIQKLLVHVFHYKSYL